MRPGKELFSVFVQLAYGCRYDFSFSSEMDIEMKDDRNYEEMKKIAIVFMNSIEESRNRKR